MQYLRFISITTATTTTTTLLLSLLTEHRCESLALRATNTAAAPNSADCSNFTGTKHLQHHQLLFCATSDRMQYFPTINIIKLD